MGGATCTGSCYCTIHTKLDVASKLDTVGLLKLGMDIQPAT